VNGPTWQEPYYIVAALSLAGGAVAGTVVWLFTRFSAHERDLSEFKLKVAEDYATTKLVERVESKMTDAVNRVADSVSRMNEAFNEAVRMMMRRDRELD
jgi:transposase-like protein